MKSLRYNQSHGFSLIELIIAMSLIAILSGILASIIGLNFKIMGEVSDRKKLITRGSQAVTLFERELGLLIDSTNIVTADDQQLKFTDKNDNTWEYLMTSSNFTRQEVSVGSALTLANPIINADSKFYYYDGDNVELTSLPLSSTNLKLVRLIKLVLVMDDGQGGASLIASVYPENMKVYNK